MPPSLHNIVLVGFMGTGKSTIGRQLAEVLHYPQVDTDQLIVQKEGRPITNIFNTHGEAYFRAKELETLQTIVQEKVNHHIISTGGGLIGQVACCELLKEIGFVIWLDASVESIIERTSQTKSRPLLNTANPEKVVEDLLKVRNPIYEKVSHLRIDTAKLTPDEISTGIIESARYHFTKCDPKNPA